MAARERFGPVRARYRFGVRAREGQGHQGHGHRHAAVGAGNRRRLAIVLAITTAVLVVEVVGAAVSGSLALPADAGHALTDVAGLSLALVAATLAGRPATPERTWGYRRAEVLAAAAQAAPSSGPALASR